MADSNVPNFPLPPASAEEMALVARLRSRDRTAFADLLTRLHGPLVRMARMYVPSDAIAEEVVQETWLGVLTGLADFEGRSTLKTWIFRILINRAKTRGQRESRSVPFSATDVENESESAVDPARFREDGMWASPPSRWEDGTPERLLGNKEMALLVLRAIDKLPERQRIVLTLRDIDGFDAEEVRNILGISETNQRVLLHRARSKVRNELEHLVSEG